MLQVQDLDSRLVALSESSHAMRIEGMLPLRRQPPMNERIDIVGVGGKRAIEKAAPLRDKSGFGVCSARRASAAASCVFSAPATRATISSCMSKRSASGLSNRSAQR